MIDAIAHLSDPGYVLLVDSLFPRGTTHYLLGGLLIGLGTAVIYAGTGIPAGASTFLESTLSYVSRLRRFQQPRFVSSRDWRVVFTVGIVAGAAGYSIVAGEFGWVTEVQPWRLFLGGILIGIGTRLGKGCTSGHGVCGVGSGSGTSIVNVAVFMAVAIGVAQLLFALGVRP
ncbi:MAG: YeeE/YedE thiosulfate transporter family protein [Haloferacaceae archaeon]